ncbi:uncharacterized protein [Hoplias malabaricus]|uniref:uncharacterized protein n=1 Tax=Hoplias malabaricus TaxID=27720 RepID=UPI0034632991
MDVLGSGQSSCPITETLRPLCKYFTIKTGETQNCYSEIKMVLHKRRPELQEVSVLDKCDVILVFSPDTDAALNVLPVSKPAILFVLHQPCDHNKNLHGSNTHVSREDTLRVDCLLNDKTGLQKCNQNDEALCRVADWLIPERSRRQKCKVMEEDSSLYPPQEEAKKIFTPFGKTLPIHKDFVRNLCKHIAGLEEVSTLEECDFVLGLGSIFCTGTSNRETLRKLKMIPDTKPAVLVVLHHTSNTNTRVPDSSTFVTRKNTLTMNFVYQDDQILPQCPQNDESLRIIADWLIPEDKKESSSPVKYVPQKEPEPVKTYTAFVWNTPGFHLDFMRILKLRAGLREVSTVEECDVILTFCRLVSDAATDIKEALRKLSDLSATKPVLLVVLHQTFDITGTVADSSKFVTRENTLTVDFLFHEQTGLLHCTKNNETLRNVSKWIKNMANWSASLPKALTNFRKKMVTCKVSANTDSCTTSEKRQSPLHKYFRVMLGKTLNCNEEIKINLHRQRMELQEVSTLEDCDVILVFCPVLPPLGIYIEAVLRILFGLSVSKPAVLMALHHTSDMNKIIPDISRIVTRENTFTVDLLFQEDRGLLECTRNDEALCRVADWLIPEENCGL